MGVAFGHHEICERADEFRSPSLQEREHLGATAAAQSRVRDLPLHDVEIERDFISALESNGLRDLLRLKLRCAHGSFSLALETADSQPRPPITFQLEAI